MMPNTVPQACQDQAADLHQHSRQDPKNIPRISRDHRLKAAFRGIWLHAQKRNQGRLSVPDLVFWLVAGVGFEPT
jgi:hypothetical protein